MLWFFLCSTIQQQRQQAVAFPPSLPPHVFAKSTTASCHLCCRPIPIYNPEPDQSRTPCFARLVGWLVQLIAASNLVRPTRCATATQRGALIAFLDFLINIH